MSDGHNALQTYREALRAWQVAYWTSVMNAAKWQVKRAAELADENPRTLYHMLHRIGVLKGGPEKSYGKRYQRGPNP